MSDHKKILLIMPYGSVGGMERLALTFYHHYKSLGHEVLGLKFIKLPSDIINFGEDELFLSDHDFAAMSKKERNLFYLKTPFRLRKIIKTHKITHSIAFGDMANFFSTLTFTREFKIGSIHALKSVEFQHKTFWNSIFRKAYATTYGKLDKLVCISKAIKQDMLENCGYRFESNMQVIYNPHNLETIKKRAEELIEDPKEDQLVHHKTILFLGRLSVQKAPWHLIKAFYLVQKEVPESNLVFIGDGDPQVQNHVFQLVKDLELTDKVHFLGRKENPYKYLKRAKTLALSSYYEGTPNVIVEAVSLSVPVVTTLCTQGIVEMMSLQETPSSDENTAVEGGIITPGFFKGTLTIPENSDFIEEERIFANGLLEILGSDNAKNRLLKNQSQLLDKYDVSRICEQYLSTKHS